MLTQLLQLLWLALPVALSGSVHLCAIHYDWWPWLRRAPLDFGATWRGRRLFGANKTWRGACITILGTGLFSAALAAVNELWLHLPHAVPFAQSSPFAWGVLLGSGYILGELPNSLVKRQLGIAPGAAGAGVAGRVFWLADQLDSLAGMLVFTWPVWHPAPAVIVTLVLLMLVAHPISAWIMVLVGAKDRVG